VKDPQDDAGGKGASFTEAVNLDGFRGAAGHCPQPGNQLSYSARPSLPWMAGLEAGQH